MLVSIIADGMAMWLMPKSSIMTEKLARRGMRIHAEYETDVLQQVSVGEMMDRDLPAISSDMSVGELAERIAHRDPAVSKHEGLLILDTNGNLEGIITRSDISRAFEKDSDGWTKSTLENRVGRVCFPDGVRRRDQRVIGPTFCIERKGTRGSRRKVIGSCACSEWIDCKVV